MKFIFYFFYWVWVASVCDDMKPLWDPRSYVMIKPSLWKIKKWKDIFWRDIWEENKSYFILSQKLSLADTNKMCSNILISDWN